MTEGDKILITTFASLEAQGMYALSANYGGFIARMVFKPIEESSRNLFANLCATPPQSAQATEAANSEAKASSTATKSHPKANLRTAAQILTDILHLYNTLSLLIFTLGPTGAPLLLRLVAGSTWSNSGAGAVLGTYCYYIPLLAINGVSEAFVAATADSKDLRSQSFMMTVFSFLFAGSAWLFLRRWEWGARGLVAANCVNMGLRVVFNLYYCVEWFKQKEVVSVQFTGFGTFELSADAASWTGLPHP